MDIDEEEMLDRERLFATMFDRTLQHLYAANETPQATIDRLPGRSSIQDWESLNKVLRLAGVDLEATDPFEILGFALKPLTALPSRADINRRYKDIALLAHPDGASQWDPRHTAII